MLLFIFAVIFLFGFVIGYMINNLSEDEVDRKLEVLTKKQTKMCDWPGCKDKATNGYTFGGKSFCNKHEDIDLL